MEPHRPKGQASLYDLGCTKRKHTEDDGPAQELIIRLRPDVQQAVAARDAAIAASIASRPAPVKRPVGRPKVLAPLGVQAPLGERHVWAELQLRWSGGEHQVRLHLHFIAKAAAAAAAEAQELKKAVWVRMHLQGRRGRGRGRGHETLEISETTMEEDEGEEERGGGARVIPQVEVRSLSSSQTLM